MVNPWRVVADFPSYEVSADGRVRRRSGVYGGHSAPLILATAIDRDGYHRVRLRIGSKQTWKGVHRLVCRAFHGEPPSLAHRCAAHRDGNRANNLAANLYWATDIENHRDRDMHGNTARGERSGVSRLTTAQVLEIRRQRLAGVRRKDIAAAFGIHKTTVTAITSRINWRHL